MESDETIAILIGASSWPKSNGRWPSHDAFEHSARDMEAYFRDKSGLSLPAANVVALFNDERAAADVDESIDTYLTGSQERFCHPIRNIILFYTGHGCFTENDNKYALALKSTRIENIGGSAYRMSTLARTLSKRAKQARKFLILDSCYAAAAIGDFVSQSDYASRMEGDTIDAMVESGTALLCASSSTGVAKAPFGDRHTMFTGALLEVIKHGSPKRPKRLSVNDVADLVENLINDKFREDAVRPEFHIPDQHRGSLANIGVFPNAAIIENINGDLEHFPLQDFSNKRRVSSHLFPDEYVENVADQLNNLPNALNVLAAINRDLISVDINTIPVRAGGLRLHSTSIAFWQSIFDEVSLSGHRTAAALLRYIFLHVDAADLKAQTVSLLADLQNEDRLSEDK